MAAIRATDGSWGEARDVTRRSDFWLNWADFPSVTPLTRDDWAAHWLVKQPGGTYSYDLAIALSRDGGASWGEPLTPHDDGTRTEHGFATLFAWDDGLGAVWLDGFGSPLTAAAKVTERFRRTGEDELTIEVTVDDPKAYSKPWTVMLQQRRMRDVALDESFCAEEQLVDLVTAAAEPLTDGERQ